MRLQLHQLKAIAAGQPCPAPKPKRKNVESEMQRALVKWWAAACKSFGIPERLLFSVPNGGNWSAKRGGIMKAEGQRAGVPDLVLAVARLHITDGIPAHDGNGGWRQSMPVKHHHALFIELKTPTGVLSLDQQLFHEALRSQGYAVHVCRSLEECQKTITEYLT